MNNNEGRDQFEAFKEEIRAAVESMSKAVEEKAAEWQKKAQEFRNSLKKGDKVVTIGGIYGEIAEVSETTVLLKVDGDVKIRVDKQGLVKDSSQIQNQQ